MKIFTIGHSNDSLEYFLDLIRRNGIDTVVDDRRIPYSRHARQFNKRSLAAYLNEQKIGYVFMGDILGGKITDPALLDGQGNMDYAKVTRSPRFLRGDRAPRRDPPDGGRRRPHVRRKRPLEMPPLFPHLPFPRRERA